jgi:DNA polymerase-3 subunit alpha
MVDFAKYAFNKSHAAAYAVISVQTAWLKYYYPVEFMAALMTSVIDNNAKASEYLYCCRQMGMRVLPPDINNGYGEFTAESGDVRYGLYAVKSIGRSVVDLILKERERGGKFRTLQDFIERTIDFGVNKRAVENLIKSGACDCLEGTRMQMAEVYAPMIDRAALDKKTTLSGQMSLFDLVSEEEKREYDVKLPPIGEYDRETLLFNEKEVLGIYLSGHPLEEYTEKLEKNITNTAVDFLRDEETGAVRVAVDAHVVVGGMISEKTVKFTRANKAMAYVDVEDLTGTVSVVVFPKQYERYQQFLAKDEKIFVIGRADVGDEQDGKIICERIVPFSDTRKELWLQFTNLEAYQEKEDELRSIISDSDGMDEVVLYLAEERLVKRLGAKNAVRAEGELLDKLFILLGKDNVKVVEKNIENKR